MEILELKQLFQAWRLRFIDRRTYGVYLSFTMLVEPLNSTLKNVALLGLKAF